MKNRLLPPVILSLSLLFLTASCNNRSDAEIQTDLNKELQQGTSYQRVSAGVHDGVVTLSGTCNGDNCETQIAQKVKNIKGVDSVVNNVKPQTDYTLRTSVQNIISKYKGVQADVADGAVVLRGTIDKSQLQPLMTELTALQPRKIDNQLALQ